MEAFDSYDEERHVIPVDDHIEHISSCNCWCAPKLSYKDKINGTEVWIHKSAIDGEGLH